MSVVVRHFSEFLRKPKAVVIELDDHDVILRRRSAPSLRLGLADRDEDRSAAFAVLARLLRSVLSRSPAILDEAVRDEFGWVTFLPDSGRRLFVEELTSTLVGAEEIDCYSTVTQLLLEWKATAEIYADPELSRRLLEPIVEATGGKVLPPAV